MKAIERLATFQIKVLKKIILIVGTFLLILLISLCSGCVSTPNKDIIQQKIEGQSDAANGKAADNNKSDGKGNSSDTIRAQIQAPQQFQKNIDYASEDVHITVNADVIVPDVTEIPVVEMNRDDLDSSDLENVTKSLMKSESIKITTSDQYNFNRKDLFLAEGTSVAGTPSAIRAINYVEESSILFYTNTFYSDNINMHACRAKDCVNSKNICKYTEEEALKMTDAYVSGLGIDDQYRCAEIQYLVQDQIGYGYKLLYKRYYQGVTESYDLQTRMVTEEDTARVPYSYENITFIVRDNGIEFFGWESPMKVGKVITKQQNLLPFNQVMQIFEQQCKYHGSVKPAMVAVGDAIGGRTDTPTGITAQIDTITLGYMRVAQPDREEFKLIPVWDFQGDFNNGQSIMTINAVDGSCIDRGLGY